MGVSCSASGLADTRKRFIAALTGPYEYTDDINKHLYKTIGWWFRHYGFQQSNRPADLEEKLARIICVAVYLRHYNDSSSVNFRARITMPYAPSSPYG